MTKAKSKRSKKIEKPTTKELAEKKEESSKKRTAETGIKEDIKKIKTAEEKSQNGPETSSFSLSAFAATGRDTNPRKHKKKMKKQSDLKNAKVEIHFKLKEHFKATATNYVGLKHLQNFLLSTLSKSAMPKWITVDNPSLVPKIIFLHLDGITAVDYAKYIRHMPACARLFPVAVPLQFSGTKFFVQPVIQPLLYPAIPKNQRKDVVGDLEQGCSIVSLCMTRDQLAEDQYPAEGDGWVGEFFGKENDAASFITLSKANDSANENETPPIFALDCEMCRTTEALELTRITVLNNKGEIILDELVKPENEIQDYLTKYSGITEDMLKNATKTLKDIQNFLVKNLPKSCVIVGHSLENDFRCLKLIHDKVVDTSVIFPHPQGRPYKQSLKYIAQKYLNRAIQHQSSGHCSSEDAKACLDLVNLKMKEGISFGSSGDPTESIFSRIMRLGKKSVVIDRHAVIAGHPHAEQLEWKSDANAVKKTINSLQTGQEFIFTHLYDLNHSVTNNKDDDKTKEIIQADTYIQQIYDALPEHAILVVMAGAGEFGPLREDQKRRGEHRNKNNNDGDSKKSTWTSKDEQRLAEKVAIVRKGLLFITSKRT